MPQYLILALAAALCAGCAAPTLTAPVAAYASDISLDAHQLAGLARARRDLGDDFTYAAASNGHWAYIGGVEVRNVRTALSICQDFALAPCRVYRAGDGFTQERYRQFAAVSSAAIRALPDVLDKSYHEEEAHWDVEAPSLVPVRLDSMEGATPQVLPGVRTIRTAELARLMHTAMPLVIDAAFYALNLETLPGALVIDWIGAPRMSEPEEQAFTARLATVMRWVAPDKARPLVVACASSNCWMSVSAALRLRALGYRNLLWYRGGKLAWKEAGLPLVAAVPYATLWDYDVRWPVPATP